MLFCLVVMPPGPWLRGPTKTCITRYFSFKLHRSLGQIIEVFWFSRKTKACWHVTSAVEGGNIAR